MTNSTRQGAHGIFDGIWWATGPFFTIGYGDKVPHKVASRDDGLSVIREQRLGTIWRNTGMMLEQLTMSMRPIKKFHLEESMLLCSTLRLSNGWWQIGVASKLWDQLFDRRTMGS